MTVVFSGVILSLLSLMTNSVLIHVQREENSPLLSCKSPEEYKPRILLPDRSTGDLPVDCWTNIVCFLANKSEFENVQLCSRQLNRLCIHHLNVLQSDHYQSILNNTRTQRQFRSWDQARKKIKLLDSMYLDLSCVEPKEFLLITHRKCERTFIRGFDSHSKRPFLSIKVVNDADWTEVALLIIILNHSDVNDTCLYAGPQRFYPLWNYSFSVHSLDMILRDRPVRLRAPRSDKRWVTPRGAARCFLCPESMTSGRIIINIAFVVAVIVYVFLMQYLLRKMG